MADNTLYNINCRQAEYLRVYMEQVGCSLVMLHYAAVRTVCIQINTYLSGAINCEFSLQHRVQGVSLLDIQKVTRNIHNVH
jgi:hypothetical protein